MITVATAAAGYVLPSARASRASMPMMSLTGEQELFAKFGVPSPEEYVTTRRTALSLGVGVGVAATMPFFGAQPAFADDGMFSVPPLPYAYDALEPAIGAPTMKLHHDKHHQVYITNANKAVADIKDNPSLLELQTKAIEAGPLARNGGGGAYNHDLFWAEMTSPSKSGKPSAALAKAIDDSFCSFEKMQEEFAAASTTVFGSGWGWLCVTKDKKLAIVKTPNQDNPLMEGSAAGEVMYPILGLDVWEHAYYLDYQNRRPEYIKAFWSVINWEAVSGYYELGLKGKGAPF